MSSYAGIWIGPRRCFQRNWTILRTTGAGLLRCCAWRAEKRSTIPQRRRASAWPSCRSYAE